MKWLVALSLLGSILALGSVFLPWTQAPRLSAWELARETDKIHPYLYLTGVILGAVGLLGALVSHSIPTGRYLPDGVAEAKGIIT